MARRAFEFPRICATPQDKALKAALLGTTHSQPHAEIPPAPEKFVSSPSKVLDLPNIIIDPSFQPLSTFGSQIAVALDTDIYFFNNKTNAITPLTGHNDRAGAICFNPTGDCLAVANIGGAIQLWKVATPQAPKWTTSPALTARLSMDEIPRIAFCKKHLYAIGDSGTVYQIEAKTGSLTASLTLGSPLTAIAVSPNSQYLAIGCKTGAVRIYATHDLELVKTLEPLHRAPIQAIAFDPANTLRVAIATGRNQPCIRICRFGLKAEEISIPVDTGAIHFEWVKQSRLISVHPNSYQVFRINEQTISSPTVVATDNVPIRFASRLGPNLLLAKASESLHFIPLPFQQPKTTESKHPGLMLTPSFTIR